MSVYYPYGYDSDISIETRQQADGLWRSQVLSLILPGPVEPSWDDLADLGPAPTEQEALELARQWLANNPQFK